MTPEQRRKHNEREFLLKQRQGLIIQLAAIEDYLGLPRTYVPQRKRNETMIERFDRLTQNNRDDVES